MSLDISLKINTCPHCDFGWEEVYEANITHNLWAMAKACGIYEVLRHPTQKYAWEIIPTIEKGLKKLKDKPSFYQKYNSENGWGMYEHFVPFVEKYLEACKKYPQAEITTSC